VIEAAQARLLASGAFSNVSFQYNPAPGQKGYIVTFEVTDLEQLFEYRFDRLDADDAKLRAVLAEREPLFGKRIPGADIALARLAAVLSDYLRSQNKPSDVVGHVVIDAGENVVLFSPPGPMPAVATVDFTGNKVVSLTELRNKIHPVAVGSQFREARFRELLEIGVRPLYDARGRLRMSFPRIEAKSSSEVKGLAVSVTIDEGESYSFGETRVLGVPDGDTALVKAAALPEGEVADLQLLAAAQVRLTKFMHANGHMDAEIKAERRLDDKSRLCAVDFHITPGPKYTFGKLTFQGLDLHGDYEMRRIWVMKTGETYNGEYPDLFLTRIKEDQLFDGLENARAVVTPNPKTLTVDVKLIFNERKPRIMK